MPEDTLSRLAVVGIGASAGGLDAATRLIEAWPPDLGLALILVQHSDPSGGNLLTALLSPLTVVTVIDAAEGMPVEPDHLYVVPPARYLSAAGGVLHLSSPPTQHSERMPFNVLLHSLAEQYGERAACIVLSGSGSDGTAGLASIKAAGGLVAVQDPAEAEDDGMPTTAIATGLADLVLPAAEIPAALAALRRPAVHAPASKAAEPQTARPATEPRGHSLPDIIDLLLTRTANDFTCYEPGTLQRRIARRATMAGLKSDDMAGYVAMLRADLTELQALAHDLLIHITSFFRDPAVFDVLEATTIPDLIASHPTGRNMRLWVAGCSTGEETYSLAMLFLEQIEASGRSIPLQVFASDVDASALATARDGVYSAAALDGVTPARLAQFFVHDDSGWRTAAKLRAAIVFTVQDVLADPPFSRLDMVSCRNLLIYLRPDAKVRVLEAFHFGLRDRGILLLGNADQAVISEGRFETIGKAEGIYRRIGPDAAAKSTPLARLARPGEPRQARLPLAAPSMRPAALAELGRNLVMEAYAPASVLIDATNAVLFSLGPTDRFLSLPPGHATQDLLAMARPGLRAKLRSALDAARQDNLKVTESGWIADEGASRRFDLSVHPVVETGQDLLLVCFLDVPATGSGGLGAPARDDTPQVAELQREIEATRTELQGTVRDLELSGQEQRAINAEAQSVNEEFQSTNQELLASKEELQSLNEELTAVNSQLQETLERQRTTSDDLQNVLFSTKVATLFLDLDGRIRFFTPAIRPHFAIIPNDIGRKLTDLAALSPDSTLTGDVTAVQDGLEPPDRDLESADGSWFRRSIMPYRSGDRVEGVVITFTNITARIAATNAVEVAKLAADAANAAKSRFLAAASHDLRQPLQTLALLQALLSDAVTNERARDLVARQTTTLSTVTGMLDTLLDINEIEAGAMRPDMSIFAIGNLLEQLRSEFDYHAKAKGIELRIIGCRQHVRSDKRLLEQMVRNLLSNAIKYTANGRVLLGCRRHGDMLGLEVWDTGIGMEAADLTVIFDEYYQLGNATRQSRRGLGLGLSIVKRLGDLLDHPVRVTSRPGVGSMFAIDLPWLPRSEATRPALLSQQAGGELRILVVEDDPDLSEMLAALLLSQGHRVTTVPDGPAALASVALEVPSLVLTDFNLRGGPNGLELATAIRAATGQQVPVLILTGDISHATVRAVAEAGCSLLKKPAVLPALRDAIARLMVPPIEIGKDLIFVVDDDDEVRRALTAVLEADGRVVAGYASGEAFLQAFRPRAGDCLLTDAMLPGISGIDLLEQLRAAGHNLPVIVVTGQSDVPMAIRAMKAGASDFIEKPVGRDALLASIANALEGSSDAAKLTTRRNEAAGQIAGLTARQREIMTLVLAGLPSKNIAADLGISQRTVESHRAAIMERTGAASLPALARLALAANARATAT